MVKIILQGLVIFEAGFGVYYYTLMNSGNAELG